MKGTDARKMRRHSLQSLIMTTLNVQLTGKLKQATITIP